MHVPDGPDLEGLHSFPTPAVLMPTVSVVEHSAK